MYFNLTNKIATVFAVLLCLIFFSCKKDKPTITPTETGTLSGADTVTYYGYLKYEYWGVSSDTPYYRTNTYSGFYNITVTHLHNVIIPLKDTIQVVYPSLPGSGKESMTMTVEKQSSDSTYYIENTFSVGYASPVVGTLSKYNNPDSLNMYVSYYIGLGGGSNIYFSGRKK